MITMTIEQYERLIRLTLLVGINIGLMLITGIILWINETSHNSNKTKEDGK